MKTKYVQIGTIVLLALTAIFMIQNLTFVSLSFLFWEVEMPRALLIALVFCSGYLLGITVKLNKATKVADQ